tara:strand:+ start:685 stop:1365 length:681 start_codon:yes stop_codon:yes gene_type:complete
MATSGTVAFRPNVEEIVTEAFERCGLSPQTRTGNHSVSARRSLNLLFSEWANRGVNYWAVNNLTLSLTSDTVAYSLPVGTVDLIDVVIRDSSNSTQVDIPVERISISDYNQIPNKTSSGKPTQYMLDKQYTPTINVWQSPDSGNYSLVYWSVSQLEDITASNQDADIPYRWNDCICSGLASKLAVKYAPDRFADLAQIYERAFDLAYSADNDGVSLRIRPTSMDLG